MRLHVSLLAIVALPLLAGLLICGFEGAWRRWFGAARALALAGRVALAGTLLSALLLAAAVYARTVRPDMASMQLVPWAGAGYTTALDLDLELGGLALAVSAVALVIGLAVQLAALADVQGGARSLGRTGLLLGGTLLLALAATLWGAALGWQIAMMTCLMGQGPEDRSSGTGARWADAGVWLAVLVTAVGAGDLALVVVGRAGLFGAKTSLLVSSLGGPFVGLTPASVAAVGLVVAVVARVHGLPATLREAPAATQAALLGLASGAGVVLLLRAHMLLTLAPTVMATLTIVGGAIAVMAGVAALRSGDPTETQARVSQSLLGFLLVAVGLGAWAPACGLLLAHALASGALALGRAAAGGAGHAARVLAALSLAGVLPTGATLWLGETLGVAWMYMSAWSPGLNAAAAAMCALAIVLVAGSLGHVVKDRSKGPGGAEVGLAAGLLATAAAMVALTDMPGSLTALRVGLGPELGASWMLPGDYALGPRPPYSVAQSRWAVAVLVPLAVAGLLLGGRLRVAAARLPAVPWPDGSGARRVARALVKALHELGERWLSAGLFLAPAQPRVARAAGTDNPRVGRTLALVGALMVLAVVYCNPDVAQVGPSRVYPVDVGGINPALLGSRRPAGAEPARAVSSEAQLVPGTGAKGETELAPGTGARGGVELAPGTGANSGAELAPGTGANSGAELAPGTGVSGGVELAPGTGSGGTGPGRVVPGFGVTGVNRSTSPSWAPPELVPGDAMRAGAEAQR